MADNVRKLERAVAEPAQVDEFTDRLLARRERFSYFVAAASTGVIVFTFDNFRQVDGVLRLGPDGVTFAGWLCLALAALSSLLLIPVRHARYWNFLQDQEAGRREPAPDSKLVKISGLTIDIAQWALAVLFGAGVLLLAISAGVGILKL